MEGEVHSINISSSGGVPKLPIKTAVVNFEGVEGDYNKFRTYNFCIQSDLRLKVNTTNPPIKKLDLNLLIE